MPLFALLALLLANPSFAVQYVAGDIAPQGATDGVLTAADTQLVRAFLRGQISLTPLEQQIVDVAPRGNPDGNVTLADYVLLQRAAKGLSTLSSITTLDVPSLDSVVSPTNDNPYSLTGVATPGIEVILYVNSAQQATTTADSGDGEFDFDAVLIDGNNSVYVTASDGISESAPTATQNIDYQNIIPRTQNNAALFGTVVWTPGSPPTPYTITGTLTIEATFILQPGTVLEFGPNASLQVYGDLIVQGQPGNEVLFTSSEASPAAGDWSGIDINLSHVNVTIDHAVIEYASYGIYFDRSGSVGTVTNSVIRNNSTGIYATGNNATQEVNPTPLINGNSLYGNTNYSYFTKSYVDNENVHVDATGNWWGSADPVVIAAGIYDYSDNASNSPTVDLGTYLDGEGGNPIIGLSGSIGTNTTLVAGTSYTVVSPITIQPGVTLAIPAGTTLSFPKASWRLIVDGSLDVQGTVANPVVFTSSEASPAVGDWSGIEINQSTGSVTIDHAVIEYASDGIYFDRSGSVGTVTNSVIRNNNRGIYVYGNASPVIGPGNEITLNPTGLRLEGANTAGNNPLPVISGNQIYGNISSSNANLSTSSYYNGSTVEIDAMGNYWGSTQAETIAATIYDQLDDPANPVVNFGGYLDAAGQPAVGATLVGVVNADTTLVAGTTYEVLSTITVASGVTLTIPAGTTLSFPKASWSLKVNGSLDVQGTVVSPVVFTSSEASPAAGGWGGIDVYSGAGSVTIDHAVIEYASFGIRFNNSGAVGTVTNTVLRNNTLGVGVYSNAFPVIGPGNEITLNQTGLHLGGTNTEGNTDPLPMINGNRIHGNTSSSNSNLYTAGYYNGSTVEIDATGNYWGSTQAETIAATILDQSDSSSSPVVNFGGYLDAVGQPAVGTTLVGVVNADTTLVAGTIYEVLSNITVASGVTLTIPAGITLNFPKASWSVKVNGSLDVQGTVESPVVFTSSEASPAAGDWGGIDVKSTGNATFEFVVVEYAAYGIQSRAPLIDISNSLLHFNNYGLYLYQNGANATITDSQLVYNIQYGLYAYGSNNDSTNPQFSINNSDLFGNTSSALYVTNYGSSSLALDATGNWWGTPIPQQGVDVAGGSSPVVNFASPSPSPLFAPAVSSLVVDNLYISPENGDAIQDMAILTGPLSETSDWAVEIKDSLGTVVQTANGTGTTVSTSWDGRDTGGQLLADGQYSVIVTTTAGVRTGQAGRVYVSTDNTAPVSVIDDPLSGITLQNILTQALQGSALDQNFLQYQVEYGTGVAPIAWLPVSGITTNRVNDAILDNWVVGAVDGSYPVTNGLYTVRLAVDDKAGNTTTDTVQLTVDNLAAYNVTENIAGFSPVLSETIQIDFELNLPADVTFSLYSTVDNSLVYTDAQSLLAGSNTFNWDGTDTLSAQVAGGGYYYTLTATDGTRIGNYAPIVAATATDLFQDSGGSNSFNTFENDFFSWPATAPSNGNARFRILLQTAPYANQTIYPDGDGISMSVSETREFYWDGRIPGTADIYIGTITAFLDFTSYGPNFVVVSDAAPVIKGSNTVGPSAPYLEVKADPYIVYLSYGQLVNVHYNIDRASQVTIKLLPPGIVDFDDASAVLIKDELQAAQDHSVEWQGLVTAGDGRDRSLPEDGVYTLAIKAVATDSGASTIYKAVLSAFQ